MAIMIDNASRTRQALAGLTHFIQGIKQRREEEQRKTAFSSLASALYGAQDPMRAAVESQYAKTYGMPQELLQIADRIGEQQDADRRGKSMGAWVGGVPSIQDPQAMVQWLAAGGAQGAPVEVLQRAWEHGRPHHSFDSIDAGNQIHAVSRDPWSGAVTPQFTADKGVDPETVYRQRHEDARAAMRQASSPSGGGGGRRRYYTKLLDSPDGPVHVQLDYDDPEYSRILGKAPVRDELSASQKDRIYREIFGGTDMMGASFKGLINAPEITEEDLGKILRARYPHPAALAYAETVLRETPLTMGGKNRFYQPTPQEPAAPAPGKSEPPAAAAPAPTSGSFEEKYAQDIQDAIDAITTGGASMEHVATTLQRMYPADVALQQNILSAVARGLNSGRP